MNREQIEKAAGDFAEREYMVGDIDKDALYKGFYHGANWCINSVWHDASETPEKNKHIALMFKNGNLTSWYVTDDIMQKFKEHKVMIWAYVNDLIPETKEE